jgi:hypothetical protein
MDGSEQTITRTPSRSRSCLAPGCTCADARIVSPRRAAFFASLARANGETADRVVAVEPGWRLPAAAPAEDL